MFDSGFQQSTSAALEALQRLSQDKLKTLNGGAAALAYRYSDILNNDEDLERDRIRSADDPKYFGQTEFKPAGHQRAYSKELKDLANRHIQVVNEMQSLPSSYTDGPAYQALRANHDRQQKEATNLAAIILRKQQEEFTALPKSKEDLWVHHNSSFSNSPSIGNQGSGDQNEISLPKPGDPYNRNLFVDDEGHAIDLSGGVSSKTYSEELIRKRRDKEGGYVGGRAGNPAMSEWDSFFGALAGIGNGAKAQGKNFKVNMAGAGPGTGTGFGRWKSEDVPSGRTYNTESGELAPGQRGRPDAATAALQGLDPSKGGYYTKDEWNSMTGNKWSPLTMFRGLGRR